MSFIDDEDLPKEAELDKGPKTIEDLEKIFTKSEYEQTESIKYLGASTDIKAIVYTKIHDFETKKYESSKNLYDLLIEKSQLLTKEIQKNYKSPTGRITLRESLDQFKSKSNTQYYVYVLDKEKELLSVGIFSVDVYESIYNHAMTLHYEGPIEDSCKIGREYIPNNNK